MSNPRCLFLYWSRGSRKDHLSFEKSFNFDLAGGTPFRTDSPSPPPNLATFGASREKLRHQQLQIDILKREMVDLIAENDDDMRDLLEFLHGE